jgi:hypothetical protein
VLGSGIHEGDCIVARLGQIICSTPTQGLLWFPAGDWGKSVEAA